MDSIVRLFGKKKNNKDNLQDLENNMKNKIDQLNQDISSENSNIIKYNRLKNKASAKASLIRKKRLESELSKYNNRLNNISVQREVAVNSLEDVKYLNALKSANKIMKKNSISDNYVDGIFAEIEEENIRVRALNDQLNRPLFLREEYNENELEKELEAYAEEDDLARLNNECNEVPSSFIKIDETPTLSETEKKIIVEDIENEIKTKLKEQYKEKIRQKLSGNIVF